MNVAMDVRDPSFVLTKQIEMQIECALAAALEQEGVQDDAEISVSFVGSEEIHKLNHEYRGIDQETDVLSFPIHEACDIEALKRRGQLNILGDIVINMDRVRSQAAEYGHSEEREMIYLTIHSLLHLLGYDHMEEKEKKRMRAHEESVMRAVDLPRLREREGFHSGYCTVIGRPNVGKSTLLNALLGQKLSIISNKAQTTRNELRLIYTDEKMQAIFLDTPGVQIPKNELGETMLRISADALNGVDVVLYVTDTEPTGRLETLILEKLQKLQDTPILLIINKADEAEPQRMEERKEELRQLGIFREILPISALRGDHLDTVLSAVARYLPEGPMYYPQEMVTDRSERFLITEFIREKCLKNMQEEIPHGIHVSIDQMKYRDHQPICDIYATIYVEKESHKGMVIGKGGQMLARIGKESRKEIEALLDSHVNLKLWVKVDKNWRRSQNRVKRLGFDA
ncbi:MAG: GTPase Era [Peptoniphilaceae bacterium]|nr:GTPase Era [Peptoniphilaceae bacterium]